MLMFNNIQFWIWLIVIVVTLWSRARKKTVPPASTSKPRPVAEEPTGPMSFEELLREIQAARKPEIKPSQKSYEAEKSGEEPGTLERADFRYEQPDYSNETYEKARMEAFQRPSLEETLKLEDTIVKFKQFDPYRLGQQRRLAAELVREMRDPAGFRKAFIMSEILNRRF